MIIARYQFVMETLENKVLALGGMWDHGEGGLVTSDFIEEWQEKTRTWKWVEDNILTVERRGMSAVGLTNNQIKEICSTNIIKATGN